MQQYTTKVLKDPPTKIAHEMELVKQPSFECYCYNKEEEIQVSLLEKEEL